MIEFINNEKEKRGKKVIYNIENECASHLQHTANSMDNNNYCVCARFFFVSFCLIIFSFIRSPHFSLKYTQTLFNNIKIHNEELCFIVGSLFLFSPNVYCVLWTGSGHCSTYAYNSVLRHRYLRMICSYRTSDRWP